MGEFSKAFDRFVAADPLALLEATGRPRAERPSPTGRAADKTTPGRSQPGMSADSLSRILKTAEGSVVAAGSSDVAITKLARLWSVILRTGSRRSSAGAAKRRRTPTKPWGLWPPSARS